MLLRTWHGRAPKGYKTIEDHLDPIGVNIPFIASAIPVRSDIDRPCVHIRASHNTPLLKSCLSSKASYLS